MSAAQDVGASGSTPKKARQVDPTAPFVPPDLDLSKPVDLKTWFLDEGNGMLFVGNGTGRAIQAGVAFNTGSHLNGLCERLQLMPNGTCVATILLGIHNAKTPDENKAKAPVRYLVFRGGHGEVA